MGVWKRITISTLLVYLVFACSSTSTRQTSALDRSEKERILSRNEYLDFPPVLPIFPVSPGVTLDGLWVFSAKKSDGGSSDIFRMEPDSRSRDSGFPSTWKTGARPFSILNSPSEEIEPYMSPDGVLVLFASNRPGSGLARNGKPSFDLYWSAIVQGKWSEPAPLGEGVNTDMDETCPSISADRNTLYFTRRAKEGEPGVLYRAFFSHGVFKEPERLPPPLNTGSDEDCLRPAENAGGFLFQSDRNYTGRGKNIYYITNIRGRWGYPVEPYEGFNTDGDETYPLLYQSRILLTRELPEKRREPILPPDEPHLTGQPGDRAGGVGLAGETPGSRSGEGTSLAKTETPKDETPDQVTGEGERSGKRVVLSEALAPVYNLKIWVRNEKTGQGVLTPMRIDPGSGLGVSGLQFSSRIYETDDNGLLEVPVAPGVEKLQITITRSGYIPYFETLDVIESMYNGANLSIREVRKRDSFNLHAIHFAYNSSEITTDSYPLLDTVADYMKESPGVRFEIIGHTDLKGSQAFNSKLSLKRAEAVRDYLIGKGIGANRFEVTGAGKLYPLILERSEEADRQNRRTEFRYLDD